MDFLEGARKMMYSQWVCEIIVFPLHFAVNNAFKRAEASLLMSVLNQLGCCRL